MPDPREGNYKIREELFREIQKKFETELTDQLALALQALIDQIARKTQSLLWETEEVRKTLLHSDVDESIEQARIRHGFQVLFLRFSRVAVEAFIAKPLQARERLLNERAAEIKTLEAFYQGDDKTKTRGRANLLFALWFLGKTDQRRHHGPCQSTEKPTAKNQVIQEIVNAVTAEA